MRFLLASASPRRREILSKLLPVFEVIPSSEEEKPDRRLPPEEYVAALARAKAENVFEKNPDAVVLGADTIVWFEGEYLGKPSNAQDAKDTLLKLSGKEHRVYTGYCICRREGRTEGVCCTKVFFRSLSVEFIDEYVRSGKPLDKAGSYGIQDDARLVERYEGSYTNIVGLPQEKIKDELEKIGVIK